MKALVLAPFTSEALAALERLLPVTYESWTDTRRLADPEELARRIEAEGYSIVVVEADFLPEEVFQQAPALRLVGVTRTNLSHVDVAAATRHGVAVVNTPGRNAQAVAELTIGLMLALARNITSLDSYTKEGRWQSPVEPYVEPSLRGSELGGKTLGILGLGRVGQRVARLARAFDMRVLAYDPYLNPVALSEGLGYPVSTLVLEGDTRSVTASLPSYLAPAAEGLGNAGAPEEYAPPLNRVDNLAELLARSDYISMNLPDTPGTRGLLDRGLLSMVKPGCRIINTGSFQAVDQAALVDALRTGHLAGAAFDVFETHPIAPNSPLLGLENVVLTPHIGGATPETVARHSQMMVQDIHRFLHGLIPHRLANPEVWGCGG